jgi:hypothetical protein
MPKDDDNVKNLINYLNNYQIEDFKSTFDEIAGELTECKFFFLNNYSFEGFSL